MELLCLDRNAITMHKVNKASIATADARLTSIHEGIQIKVSEISGPWKWFAGKTILFDTFPLNNSGEGHTESWRATKWMGGQFWRPFIFSHTAQSPISEWSWFLCFLKGRQEFSAGNRLEDKANFLCWTLNLAWRCGYRMVNNYCKDCCVLERVKTF